MNTSQIVLLVAAIGFINGLVWTLFFWYRGRRMANTRAAVERSGQTWVMPPENSYYQGSRGRASVSTMGAMGMTDTDLIFIPPLGRNAVYPLKDVVDISSNTWFHGNYRNGREFMILKLADGREVGFQVRGIQRWTEEIRSRMPSSS